jgi:excisionase family DNA binding protein
MKAQDARPLVPRLALRREEAAEALGVSDDFFDARIRAELRVVRRGKLMLYPTTELQAWLEKNAGLALEEPA